MSSSGGNPLKEAERSVRDVGRKFRDDPLGELVRAYSNLATGGLAQYNPRTGKIGYGSSVKNTDEFVGELSGRNKSRIAGYQADEALRTAEEDQKKDLLDRQLQAYRSDVTASRSAQSIRNTAQLKANVGLGGNSDGRDFLGA